MVTNNNESEDLRKNFPNPPIKYGPLPHYWWEYGKLEKDKLLYHLKELKEKGCAGFAVFNQFFPGDKGSTVPAYFTEKWWDIIEFIVEENKKLGLEFWFACWEGRQYWQGVIKEELKRNPKLGIYITKRAKKGFYYWFS